MKQSTARARLTGSDWLFFAIVFVMFYLLDRFSFMTSDDYVYSIVYSDTGTRPLTSLKEAFLARIPDYIAVNGRFLVHVIIGWFCGVLGVGAFQVVNSLVFTLLNIGIVRLVRQEAGRDSLDKYMVLAALLILLPQQGETMLGSISMSINYLWSGCAVIWFLVMHQHLKAADRASALVRILAVTAAVVVGSLQESYTLVVSAALFVYYCVRPKEFRGIGMWLTIGFWLGTCVVTFAPGNFVRLGSTVNTASLTGRLGMGMVGLILAAAVWISYRKGTSGWRAFFNRDRVYFYCAIFSLLLLAVLGAPRRAYTSGAIFISILLILCLLEFKRGFIDRHSTAIKAALCVLLLAIYIPVYGYRKQAHDAYKGFYNSPVTAGCVVDNGYMDARRKISASFIGSKYVAIPVFEKWMLNGYSDMRTGGKDDSWVSAILPAPQDSLIEYMEGDSVFINEAGGYCILRKDTVTRCMVVPQPKSLSGKLKQSIKSFYRGDSLDVTEELTPFVWKDRRYYILYTPDYGVKELEVE